MRTDITNCYAVLGVESTAGQDELKAARRRLQRLHHPDRGGRPEASARINAAYDVLNDETTRAEHDLLLCTATDSSDGPTSGTADDPWADWSTFAEDPSTETDPQPSRWNRPSSRRKARTLTRGQRIASFAVNAMLSLVTIALAGWIVMNAQSTEAITAMKIPLAFIAAGLLMHGLTWGAHAVRKRRASGLERPRRPSGGTVLVATSALLMMIIAASTLPAFAVDDSEAAGQAPGSIIGEALPAGSCDLVIDGDRRLPDPECSPGVVAGEATAAMICAGEYRPPRPSKEQIRMAMQQVARAYSTPGQPVDARDVVFVVPIRLGGVWALGNMWPGANRADEFSLRAGVKRACETVSPRELHRLRMQNLPYFGQSSAFVLDKCAGGNCRLGFKEVRTLHVFGSVRWRGAKRWARLSG